jgi:hypothetical protein
VLNIFCNNKKLHEAISKVPFEISKNVNSDTYKDMSKYIINSTFFIKIECRAKLALQTPLEI